MAALLKVDEGVNKVSYPANENERNYGLSLNQCDCCHEKAAPFKDSAKTTRLPPNVEEWILKTKNRIAQIDKSYPVYSDAMISAENNVDKNKRASNANTTDSEASWTEDFELKFDSTDESQDELENDENRDSNNVDCGKKNFVTTKDVSNKLMPISVINFYKEIKANCDIAMKEQGVDKKIKDTHELTDKMANDKKETRKRHRKLSNLLKHHLSTSDDTSDEKTLVKPRKPRLRTKADKAEATIAKPQIHDIANLFNAKVVLERLPASSLPPSNTKLSDNKTSSKASQLPSTGRNDTTSKFRRYCPRCKSNDPKNLTRKNLKCSKCSAILSFKCTTCNDDQFNSYNNLMYHRKTKCCVVQVFECEHCDYKTAVSASLKAHVGRKHPKSFDECPNKLQKKYKHEDEALILKPRLLGDNCKGEKGKVRVENNKKSVRGRRVESKFPPNRVRSKGDAQSAGKSSKASSRKSVRVAGVRSSFRV